MEQAGRLRAAIGESQARAAERLGRLLPICAWCKKVRGDDEYRQRVEQYAASHRDLRFTHGMCPGCIIREVGALRPPAG